MIPIKQPLFGAGATLLASIVSLRYFPEYETMATCAFVSFGLGSLMEEMLIFNREVIWNRVLAPDTANRKLSFEIAGIFVGIFFTAMILNLAAPLYQPFNLEEVYSNSFTDLLSHNLKVLAASSLLSFIYRGSGLVLVLCWNALGWAQAISMYLGLTASTSGLGWSSLLAIGLIPHLFCEALSYIIAGMGALFFSKAITKYQIQSAEFKQVLEASIKLLIISGIVLLLSVVLEIHLAQPLFHSIAQSPIMKPK